MRILLKYRLVVEVGVLQVIVNCVLITHFFNDVDGSFDFEATFVAYFLIDAQDSVISAELLLFALILLILTSTYFFILVLGHFVDDGVANPFILVPLIGKLEPSQF